MNEFLLNASQLFLKGTDRDLAGGTVASVVITGLVVVFLGLVLLILLVMGYGKLFEFIDKKKSERSKKRFENNIENTNEEVDSNVSSATQTVPVVEDGIDDEVVAVIAAAIAAMSAKSGKKLNLRSVKNAKSSRPVWANAGIIDNTRPF